MSVDSLDDGIARAMNGVDFPITRVLDGIAAAREAGLEPIKINTVVRRGLNEASILPLARWARDEGLILRFIEYMDVGTANGWRLDDVVPAEEILATIDAELPLEPVSANYRGEVAGRYRFRDGSGEVGVIASVSRPFCGDCTRARLSADGQLYTCLFATRGTDLKTPLRNGESDTELEDRIRAVWAVAGRPLLRAPQRSHRAPPEDRDVRPRRLSPIRGPPRPAPRPLRASPRAGPLRAHRAPRAAPRASHRVPGPCLPGIRAPAARAASRTCAARSRAPAPSAAADGPSLFARSRVASDAIGPHRRRCRARRGRSRMNAASNARWTGSGARGGSGGGPAMRDPDVFGPAMARNRPGLARPDKPHVIAHVDNPSMSSRDDSSTAARRLIEIDIGSVVDDIRSTRVELGLSQAELAGAARVSVDQVSRIERRLIDRPALDHLAAIASVLGMRLRLNLYPEGEPIRDRVQRRASWPSGRACMRPWHGGPRFPSRATATGGPGTPS